MQIVCPKCQTSYGVKEGAIGPAGRNVRCARCKEVWLARPEEEVPAHEMAAAEPDGADSEAATQGYASDRASPRGDVDQDQTPVVESPPLAHDGAADSGWSVQLSGTAGEGAAEPARARRPTRTRAAPKSPLQRFGMPAAIAAMLALIWGLGIWRVDIVRAMPQTGGFFKMIGLNVNLRNLKFESVTMSTETEAGERFIVVSGTIMPVGWKSVEVPRLHLVLNDETGAPIYSWNVVADQPMLHPGENTTFKARLASPPRNARELVVRFFNKRDLAAGGT